MYRYVAVVWDPSNLENVRALHALSSGLTSHPVEWPVAFEGPGTIVVHRRVRDASGRAYHLGRSNGVILGRLFTKDTDGYPARISTTFDEAETRKVLASGGGHIVDHYWGQYVAILYDDIKRCHYVLREPTGNLPCFHARHAGIDIFFSNLEDCVRLLPFPLSVSEQYLARWLVFSRLTSRETGIKDVEDVPGGERLTVSHGVTTRSLAWRPAELCRAHRLEQPAEAAGALRTTVLNTVSALTCGYRRIVHKLSGGLDSSIVAACLAQAPSKPDLAYLNLSMDVDSNTEQLFLPGVDKRTAEKLRAIAGHGNEKYFARLVADKWGVPLIERERMLDMDFSRLWSAPLMTSPALYFSTLEVDDAEMELVRSFGAEAFFSGQAGDSVLLATMQPLPAIDFAYTRGLGSGFWNTLVSASVLSKESLWVVLAKAIKYGVLKRPYPLSAGILGRDTVMNSALAASLTERDFLGPWSSRTDRLPPGKLNHLSGLDGSAYYDFVFHSGNHADHIDPLNSQPIWELMLQIPTYTVLTGGISRGLARMAFSDLLPAEIRARQVKGSGGTFYQRIVRRNIQFLREHLLGGLLVSGGFLDRCKLEACLTADEPFIALSATDILSYLAAEIWLQQLSQISSRATQTSPTYKASSGSS